MATITELPGRVRGPCKGSSDMLFLERLPSGAMTLNALRRGDLHPERTLPWAEVEYTLSEPTVLYPVRASPKSMDEDQSQVGEGIVRWSADRVADLNAAFPPTPRDLVLLGTPRIRASWARLAMYTQSMSELRVYGDGQVRTLNWPTSTRIRGLALDDHLLVTRTPNGLVQWFDPELRELGRIETSKRTPDVHCRQDPLLLSDRFVVYVGVDARTKADAEILACSRDGSTVIWSRKFSSELSCFEGDEQNLYIAYGDRFAILDSSTGAVLLDQATGLRERGTGDKLTRIDATVRPWADRVVVASETAAAVQVYERTTGQLLVELTLPEQIAASGLSFSYAPFHGFYPVEERGQLLISLHRTNSLLKGCGDAVLVLDPGSRQIAYAPRPAFELEVVRLATGAHEYLLRTRETQLARLLRHADIALREVAHSRGAQIWSGQERDEKWNGRLYLQVDHGLMSATDLEELRALARMVAADLERLSVYAGDKRGNVLISLEALETSHR